MDASTPLASASTTTKSSPDLSLLGTSLVTIYNKQTGKYTRLDEIFVRRYGTWAVQLDNWNKGGDKMVEYSGSSKMLDCLVDLAQYRDVRDANGYDLETLKIEADKLFIVYEKEGLFLVPTGDTSVLPCDNCSRGVKYSKTENVWIFTRKIYNEWEYALIKMKYTTLKHKGVDYLFWNTLSSEIMATQTLCSDIICCIAVDLDRRRIVWVKNSAYGGKSLDAAHLAFELLDTDYGAL